MGFKLNGLPFDYPDLFARYGDFLGMMRIVALDPWRDLDHGRIAAIICDDTPIDGEKSPVVADTTKIGIQILRKDCLDQA